MTVFFRPLSRQSIKRFVSATNEALRAAITGQSSKSEAVQMDGHFAELVQLFFSPVCCCRSMTDTRLEQAMAEPGSEVGLAVIGF